MRKARLFTLGVASVLAAVVAGAATGGHHSSAATIGTALPAGFPTITDASLGTPVLGFGAAGRVKRTPVIFLHGNNDTPFPTSCNAAAGKIHDLAQAFVDRGYSPSEIWGLGYQGDQCDLAASPTNRSATAHTTAANVDDLARFVAAVLEYTGEKRVDIVATASAEPSRASGCAAMMPTTSFGTSSRSPRRTTGSSTARPRR